MDGPSLRKKLRLTKSRRYWLSLMAKEPCWETGKAHTFFALLTSPRPARRASRSLFAGSASTEFQRAGTLTSHRGPAMTEPLILSRSKKTHGQRSPESRSQPGRDRSQSDHVCRSG